jgi:hypothetical protein
MKALGSLRNENLKFDVDLDNGYIYINEAEASGPDKHCSELLEPLISPRKCFLRTVSVEIGQDGKITYGQEGSGVSTGTIGLLKRIKNTSRVEIIKGFIYYPKRKAFWITGVGYYSVDKLKGDLGVGKKYSQKVLQYWDILNKLVTFD